MIINNVTQEQVKKIREALMPDSQKNGINFKTILNLEKQPTNNSTGTQFQGQLNNYTTASEFQGKSIPPQLKGQANSRFLGEVNNYSTVSQLQQRPNNNVITRQFQRQSNAQDTDKFNMIFPIPRNNSMLGQINSNEVNNNYPNAMNQNQLINNRNSSYNSNNNDVQSLIRELISMEKISRDRMHEHNLKQEEINNWFRNSVHRQEQYILWFQRTVGELKNMNKDLQKDISIHEKRLKYQEKLTEEIYNWVKNRFPNVSEKHPIGLKKKIKYHLLLLNLNLLKILIILIILNI